MTQSSNPSRITSREKMVRALELRKVGATLTQIAATVGYKSRSSAHKAICRALAELPRHDAEELRLLEGERLDRLWRVFYEQALVGNIAAGALCVQISAQRTKLFGFAVHPDLDELDGIDIIIQEVPHGYFGDLPEVEGSQEGAQIVEADQPRL